MAETAEISPPPAPEGYDDPYRVDYPTTVLLVGSLLLGIGAMASYSALLWLVQGPEIFDAVFESEELENGAAVTTDLTAIAIPFLSSLVITVVVHELIHGLVFQRHGYEVQYGFLLRKGAFFTAALGQFQRREHLYSVALAPLVIITIVFLPLLFVPVPLIAITALFVLIVNTAGAIGDVYLYWVLTRLPAGSLFYDVDIERMYVYQPLND